MKVPVQMVRLSISPFLSAVKFSLIRYAGQLSRAKRPVQHAAQLGAQRSTGNPSCSSSKPAQKLADRIPKAQERTTTMDAMCICVDGHVPPASTSTNVLLLLQRPH